MRICQLTHKPAYPTVDGGCIAMAHVLESLLRSGNTVDVLTLSTFKHRFDESAFPSNDRLEVRSVEIDLRTKVSDALKNLGQRSSYIMARFDAPQVRSALQEQLNNGYDVIYIESIFWLPYLPELKSSGIPLVLRSHNIEHRVWRELAYKSSFPRSAYLRLLARRLRREEHLMWQGVDQIHSISSSDSTTIAKHTSADVIDLPMAVKVNDEVPNAPKPFVCHHLGAMDWIPNQEGMRWFLGKVWPGVQRVESLAEFHLAGRRMSVEFQQMKGPGVRVIGAVDDAKAFRAEHGVLVVPLFSGSGLRIKILEALAEGVPVMATTKAIEGLPEVQTSGMFVSDDPLKWIKKLSVIWHRPVEGQKMAEDGKAYAKRYFGMDALDIRLSESLRQL